MGFATLALAVALNQGQQVSGNVIRELLELPARDEGSKWRLARSLLNQGENKAAFIVIESLPNKTAGNLYSWYRRDGDVARMLREIDVSYDSPEALPKIVEEAIYFGGVDRAHAALAYMQEYGFYSARRYLGTLDEGFHDCSPAMQAYVLFADEGLAVEATSILPSVEVEEIRHHYDILRTILGTGGLPLIKGFLAVYPYFFEPGFLLYRARLLEDDDLKEMALQVLLFGNEPGVPIFGPSFWQPIEFGVPGQLVLELYEQGSRATATRLVHKYWPNTIANYKRWGPRDSSARFLDVLAKNGHGDLLSELAETALEAARSEFQPNARITADRYPWQRKHYETALRIYVVLNMNAQVNSLVAEYAATPAAKTEVMFGGGSLQGFWMSTLAAIGRHQEAVEYSFDEGSVAGASQAVRNWIQALQSVGDEDGARAVMRRFLVWLREADTEPPDYMGWSSEFSLIQMLRELGLREELRALAANRWSGSADEYSVPDAWSAVLGFSALGDLNRAREFMRVVLDDPFRFGYGPGSAFASWLSITGLDAHVLEKLGGTEWIQVSMDRVIGPGVTERSRYFSMAENLVASLAYVQGNARLVDAVLRQIERLLDHTPEDRRQRIERELLATAVQTSRPETPFYSRTARLRVDLQERVLRVVLDGRRD